MHTLLCGYTFVLLLIKKYKINNIMKSLNSFSFFIIIGLFSFLGNNVQTKSTSTPLSDFELEDISISGANILEFGPDNVLFVGDSKKGLVHAVPTLAEAVKDPIPFNMKGIDRTIAAALDIAIADLIVNDMKIHPVSQEAYVAVKRGHAPESESMIAIVSPLNGKVSFLDFSVNGKSQVSIQNPVTEQANFWRDIPANTLTITDLDYHEGFLYVAGLTNGEFASSLRKIAYPFDGSQSKVGSIEMYHAVHTQMETRAPIRTMAIEKVDGEPTLIAAYTCTPLVSMPLSEVEEGNHIKAKTVAELGFGNVPIDMLTFNAQEMDGSIDKKLLITNKQRSGSLISLKDFEKAMKGGGLSGFTQGPAGVEIFPVPLSGVMHIDNQNPMMLTILRRNMDTGGIDLLSELKGAYLRLSDFINEYDFSTYQYKEGSEQVKGFHDMIKNLEGYPELTSENMKRH